MAQQYPHLSERKTPVTVSPSPAMVAGVSAGTWTFLTDMKRVVVSNGTGGNLFVTVNGTATPSTTVHQIRIPAGVNSELVALVGTTVHEVKLFTDGGGTVVGVWGVPAGV